MNYQLLTDIVTEFYGYNNVPVWIIDNDIAFTTLDGAIVSDEAREFLREFPKDKISVNSLNELEYYISMPCRFAETSVNSVLVVGSYCIHPINANYRGRLAAACLIRREKLREYLLSTPPIDKTKLLSYANLLARLTDNPPISSLPTVDGAHSLKRLLDRDLTEFNFTNAENEILPYSPESERRLLDMVKAGDVDSLCKVNTSYYSDKAEFEVKYLYKIIALITLATRAAIEAGADTVDAYGLSDLYLKQLELAKTDKQVSQIAKDVLPHFAELVNKSNGKTEKEFSRHLSKAEKYIKTHLHFPLSLQQVAEAVGINDKYLSRLFVKCKGEKFSHYVNRRRVNEAKELLVNTDLKLTDIAYSLAFVSESYFIKVFNDIVGTTPQKYRDRFR